MLSGLLRKQAALILLCCIFPVEVIAMDEFYLDKGQAYIDNVEKKILTFELGRTRLSEVKESMGTPFREAATSTPKGSNMRKNGTLIVYYARKLVEDVTKDWEVDKYHIFCFDLEGKLVKVWRTNITTPLKEEDIRDIEEKITKFTVNKTQAIEVRKSLGLPAREELENFHYPGKLEAGSMIFRYDIERSAVRGSNLKRMYFFAFSSKKTLVDIYRHDFPSESGKK